ncbi:MAG: formate dehydrogenase accessory sulfurtransferase FdhD [Leptothrix sp. (in: b-proteobacteria)]
MTVADPAVAECLTDLPGAVRLPARVLRAGQTEAGQEWVADEVPVALVYNGISHAVMMATPADLADFALGFSLSEGILAGPDELLDLEIESGPAGITLQLTVTARRLAGLKERRRSLAGRTGCGLCGTESLAEVVRPVAPLADGLHLAPAAIERAMLALAAAQPLNQATGATHAAAWCDPSGRLLLLREDVGRHNALDKLIGALRSAGLDTAAGLVAVTSRASFEMVHKCASAGIGLLAAISAPTRLAVELAASANLTLIGFARGSRATVYAGAQRLEADPAAASD